MLIAHGCTASSPFTICCYPVLPCRQACCMDWESCDSSSTVQQAATAAAARAINQQRTKGQGVNGIFGDQVSAVHHICTIKGM